jgi:hypothetical protein
LLNPTGYGHACNDRWPSLSDEKTAQPTSGLYSAESLFVYERNLLEVTAIAIQAPQVHRFGHHSKSPVPPVEYARQKREFSQRHLSPLPFRVERSAMRAVCVSKVVPIRRPVLT